MKETLVQGYARDPRRARLLEQERAIVEVTEHICGLMRDEGITQVELARRLGRSKSHVSQLLGGERNMTIRTLADILWCMDQSLRVDSTPTGKGEERATVVTIHWPRRQGPWSSETGPDSESPHPRSIEVFA